MNILPQIIYMFRSLPIPAPTRYLTFLSRSLKSYMWTCHMARCFYLSLIKHKASEVAGFRDVRDYYWAIHLDQPKNWFSSTSPSLWVDIESNLSPTSNLNLFRDTWETWDLKPLSEPMQVSLMTCGHLLHAPSSPGTPVHITYPIQILEILIPSIMVKPLLAFDIHKTNTLFKNNVPLPLE